MSKKYEAFLQELWAYYDEHGRDLPWRRTNDPYKIMVSEIMLQQTQVGRVAVKYEQLLEAFPDVGVLANAPLASVLKLWSGLGYNRRAKYLHTAAQIIRDEYKGNVPDNLKDLVNLPGIGHNTAGAILAYAFNKPAVFIETNIRTVYIHYFFKDQSNISDQQIIELINKTIDKENPRDFYWALMDWGTYIKSTIGNVSKNSKHYSKQSKFEGSLRQVRGKVLRELGVANRTLPQLLESIQDERVENVLTDLQKEKMITRRGQNYCLG